jgi:glycosyltransferase domain-containing protein
MKNMSEYNKELTLILLTHNRKKFLERAVSYYANFPFKLLILDSSKVSNAPLLDKYKDKNQDVDYIHYHSDAYGDLVKKIKYGVSLVKTEYVLFVADDDFTLLNGIQDSLHFLKNNADYGMCHGYSMMYLADAKEVHYFQYAKKISGDYSREGGDRIIDFMAEYHPPFYAVQKTALLSNWFERIYDDISFEFSEFGHAFHMLNLAKAHVLQTPFMVRELNYPYSEHLTDLRTAMETKNIHPEKREYFYSFLERLLLEVNPQRPSKQVRDLIEQSSQVLVSCLQLETSLQLAELFFSTAESTPQKLDWTFLAKQPITELPFYSATFFNTLAEIDTLIRVMPCGKLQLDSLSKLPRQQNDPYMALRIAQGHFIDELSLISPRVAVVLHLFYLEQWDEIKPLLLNIPYDFDLFVSTIAENKSDVMSMLAADFPKAKLYITENKGRDIGPLFELLQHENLANYNFVCKLHTKKSPHLDPDLVQKWREELLVSLLPSKEGVQAIFDLFNTRPEVGIVTGAGVLVHAHYTPGGNIGLLRELAARLGFNLDETAYEFPGGSMFWCRGSVFNSFNALNISADDFEPEAGQTNGTLAHAIERLFPLIAYHQGLLTVDAGYQGHVPNPRFPNSSEEYLHWLSKQALSIPEAKLFDLHAAAVPLPKVKICIVDRFANKSGLIASINSVSRQFYADVELLVCSSAANPMPASGIEWIQVKDGFYSAVLDTLAQQECAWLGLMEAGDQLTMSGLLLAMHQLAEHPEWKAVYFDDDVMNADGRPACPRFKPDFDINLLRSIPYADGFLLLRADAAFTGIYQQLEGWGGEQLTLLLHCYEQYGAKSIGHIPELVTHLQINDSRILSDPRRYKDFSQLIEMHLQRAGVDAEVLPNGRVEGAVRVKYALPERPLVSIIIPTKNQLPILQRCIESILEKTSYSNYEIIIIDNNSDDPQVQPYLEQLELLLSDRLRVFSYPHVFNFSAINNAAVGQANGEYLVLLNNDTAMIQDSWLDELLHHAMRPEVGIVGAKLLYPNGLVQHAGAVLGLRGPADHPFIGASLEESGYMHRLQLDQQYSVVTAACMMIRKSVYVQAGGMDEQDFKVSYNDVDLCLKVKALGYSTVWTPYSVVMHEGSVSQTQINPDKAAAKQLRFEGEQLAMYRKWRPEIGNDPAYNKNLTLSGNGFELEHRSLLSWRPLSWKPLPVVLCHPADQTGCGQYRILQPFAAMQEEQKISGAIAFALFPVFELAKLAPDVMVFQRQISAQQIDFLRLSKACAPSFKVYELDDYLPNIPIKSVHRSHMPKDVVKSLRKALTFVDRFTVSTDELASAYQGMHSVMHVVNNYLPVPLWGDLHSEKNQGKKPRVGWAGGASHTGDLELIESVVKALASEVEWVFFGMCPDKLRPFVHEFHAGVPIGLYPAKLASLNLDLALAPLEQNIFNQCKSNLRLLEYGVCGFPVICTDIAPYQCNLPVTRVKNKHKDWVEAIRSHLADLDASARMGRELKAAVLKNWMLDGANLDKWCEAWLPN